MYNHKSPSVALDDVAEPTKFMNPSTGNAIIGNALTTVFLLVFAGALAGFIPAYRAAKIKPIVALRDE